jgi:hypothetical protein
MNEAGTTGFHKKRKGIAMKKSSKLRLIGGLVMLFNLWLLGKFELGGIPVLLLTLGFIVGYEYLVVRPAAESEEDAG